MQCNDNQGQLKTNVNQKQMLGDHSFAVLGLDREGKSQAEVLAVLAEYKDAGNMTEKQTMEVQQLAVDTQVGFCLESSVTLLAGPWGSLRSLVS